MSRLTPPVEAPVVAWKTKPERPALLRWFCEVCSGSFQSSCVRPARSPGLVLLVLGKTLEGVGIRAPGTIRPVCTRCYLAFPPVTS